MISTEKEWLHYNRYRYYDPEVGRYVSKDPIGYGGGLNIYAYVLGDPVNFIDPEGLLQIFESGNSVTFHSHPGPQAGGNEHARAGPGENYHVHVRDRDGHDVRISTETWKALTPEDERMLKKSPKIQRACENLTDGQKKFFDRINRQVFHRGAPTHRQLMRLMQMRLGGRAGAGRGNE